MGGKRSWSPPIASEAAIDFAMELFGTISSLPDAGVSDTAVTAPIQHTKGEFSFEGVTKQEETAASSSTETKIQKLRKPNNIFPCPRCSSAKTEFCKTCQRFWTSGGTLRNVPENKNPRALNQVGDEANDSSSRGTETRPGRIAPAMRIDDPMEAAKSSIWSTLGMNSKKIRPFDGFRSRNFDGVTAALRANPAASARSFHFHESAEVSYN